MANSRIVINPDIPIGKPVIAGTRLSVDFIIGLLAEGRAEDQLLTNYPGLVHEDVLSCLAYARDILRAERVFISAA